MKTNKLEYKGEKLIISFNPKEGIIFLKEWGGINEKKAIEMKEKIIEFLEKIPPDEPTRLLIVAEKYIGVTPEARRALFSLAKIVKGKKARIALVSSSPAVRVLARFIAFGIKNFKPFSTKEEGMKWLKSKKK